MSNRDHRYTLQMAEQAIERIKALGLPADPTGFELWYTYVSGRNEALNRRINRLIENNGGLSVGELDNVYKEFLLATRTDLRSEMSVPKFSPRSTRLSDCSVS